MSQTERASRSQDVARVAEPEILGEAEQTQAAGGLRAIPPTFFDGRMSSAQRQALVQRVGQRYGNQQVMRMLNNSSKAAAPAQTIAPHLTVVERAPEGQVQRGFWGDLWNGIKSVGSAIGNAISGAFSWLADRLGDAARAVVELIRTLPERLSRLASTIVEGMRDIVTFVPEAIQFLASRGLTGFGDWLWQKALGGAAWVGTLFSRVLDACGAGEAVEFLMHMMSKATPLTDGEKTAAKAVLGESAINWEQVRVAEGGFLALVFRANHGRAFTTFHTINIPSEGAHARSNTAIMVHELTHVYQYEKAGSLYLGQAIHAQATIGYGYGGADGLTTDRAAGKHYADYNREQQAQIAQDYYTIAQGRQTPETAAYDPFIAELKAGQL